MDVLRYVAFSTDPDGGNPAGVVLDATGATDAQMAAVAAEVGYSETAFVVPRAPEGGGSGDGAGAGHGQDGRSAAGDSGGAADRTTQHDSTAQHDGTANHDRTANHDGTAAGAPRHDGRAGNRALDVRYFSPLAEVPFCGHATIATAVAYAEAHGTGELDFHTRAGLVRVATARGADGVVTATLVSVPPRTVELAPEDLAELLAALRWAADDLDPALPPRVAYAGAWHPVIAAASRARLADLDYDMARLARLMKERDWTTVDLVWRESPSLFHARNPFPPGGVVEDAATGAAAAAFGGYLRERGLVTPPATLTVRQGDDLGRPSVLTVTVPADPAAGIAVGGAAVPL